MFVDATFSCAPHPFYQCLIIMVYDHCTSSYVPILYMLMSHKTEQLYWHASNQLIALSDWRINVRTYYSNFEQAMMKELDNAFKNEGGTHIGCFFHLKQAWRKFLMTQCELSCEIAKEAMQPGNLDLLCIIPCEEVDTKGIPYLRKKLEKGKRKLAKKEKDGWARFWKYFEKQWMPILHRWNICDKDGNYFDMVNCTNNGLERYNCRFNKIFPTRPTLIGFVQEVVTESMYQAQNLSDIRMGKVAETRRIVQTIPSIPDDYVDFM